MSLKTNKHGRKQGGQPGKGGPRRTAAHGKPTNVGDPQQQVGPRPTQKRGEK